MPRVVPLVCLLLMLLPLAAGCSSPPAAPAAQAATATPVPATALPAVTASAATSIPVSTTTDITSTVTVTATEVEGTPTPRPTPSGPAPTDPLALVNVFDIVTPGNMVVKHDALPLDKTQPDNILATITGNRLGISQPLTQETTSALGVMTYDPVYREWNLTWQSDPISGTARPLAASTQFGGLNGGDLLRDGSSILLLRTTTRDGKAHLQVLRYDSKTHTATVLKMVPEAGAAEKDAIFDADLDVTMADLNDDGVYEVIADNVAGVKSWSWDGSKFQPRVAK